MKKKVKKTGKSLQVQSRRLTIKPPQLNAKLIRRLRKELGITMVEAARQAGMSHRQTWNNYEKGQRKSASLETVVAIARVLGCKVDDLLRR